VLLFGILHVGQPPIQGVEIVGKAEDFASKERITVNFILPRVLRVARREKSIYQHRRLNRRGQ
jgi:hypothetical protein